MHKEIRILNSDDVHYVEAMDTAIEDDYVVRIFDRLTTGNHRMYGLIIDNQLVSMGGYTIYANSYAVIGRLRSDQRFRGNNYATELVAHVLTEAFKLSDIQWVGSITQEHNTPARRVLEKIGLTSHGMLHGAITKDTTALETGAKPWNKINSMERKKHWIREVYLKSSAVFPFECYYSFPASEDLFQEENLQDWSFYENDEQTRVRITKRDQKKHHYLHAVYPWSDFTSQKGLWETISVDYRKLAAETEDETDNETYVWMDLTKEEAESLPADHQFQLPSPWVLYGKGKEKFAEIM